MPDTTVYHLLATQMVLVREMLAVNRGSVRTY